MKFSPKYFIFSIFIGLGLLWGVVSYLPDNKLHIVFCDVGQGDAIYIRFPNGLDMLVDGGPNDKVLACLGQHMPFYDRKIDLVVLTHMQKDHLAGLISVVNRYEISYFVSDDEIETGDYINKLNTALKEKNISKKTIFANSEIKFDNAKISVLWPERNWLSNLQKMTVLGANTQDEANNISPYLIVNYKDFDLLLTGDGGAEVQQEILKNKAILPQIEVFKVPHHGSRTGIDKLFIEKIKPQISVISVGKNSYGHPNQEIIQELTKWGKVLRTDEAGDIEIVSDGKRYWKSE